jgi:gamma-glutamylcyclotransferase (GGCT)/AIG2-like uncharacterized protein YtfP/cation transport regulator ChaC
VNRMIKIFVYGTLRKGEANHVLVEEAACIAEQAWVSGSLFDTGYGYPAMKQTPTAKISGELYTVTENELTRLDELEGYRENGKNNLYERIQQTVHTDTGNHIAFLYVANKENLVKKKIPSGDWKEYKLLSQPQDTVLYFAYGSCMDQKRFQEAGVPHYFQNMLGVGVLSNYTLRFTRKSSLDGMGRADIVEQGGRVEGKVYKIPVKALKEYLYHREGAPKAYRPTFVTLELNGRTIQALTFVGTNKTIETAPPEQYAEEILRGANGFLTNDYILKLQNHINALQKQKQIIGGM